MEKLRIFQIFYFYWIFLASDCLRNWIIGTYFCLSVLQSFSINVFFIVILALFNLLFQFINVWYILNFYRFIFFQIKKRNLARICHLILFSLIKIYFIMIFFWIKFLWLHIFFLFIRVKINQIFFWMTNFKI